MFRYVPLEGQRLRVDVRGTTMNEPVAANDLDIGPTVTQSLSESVALASDEMLMPDEVD